jgi:hypothetical protein
VNELGLRFSRVSRWDPKTQAEFKKVAKRILGHKAYARLKKGEQVVQDTVSYAKSTIIVRSVVVAYENLVSNALHLAVRGINPVKALTGMVSKFVEITQYVKNKEEISKLEIDIASNYNRTADRLRAEARIKALQDANDKLTIKPLIDAGEFSTISENLTEADVEIREGRWADYLEKATDKLPGWAQTGVKNALITKDTALFQGLNKHGKAKYINKTLASFRWHEDSLSVGQRKTSVKEASIVRIKHASSWLRPLLIITNLLAEIATYLAGSFVNWRLKARTNR